jgi:hypothetical protein
MAWSRRRCREVDEGARGCGFERAAREVADLDGETRAVRARFVGGTVEQYVKEFIVAAAVALYVVIIAGGIVILRRRRRERR